MLLVRGTTTTRARLRLAASLLMITAGRVLRISLPRAGSNSTHQISPRFIADIDSKRITPFLRFGLANLVCRHSAVSFVEGGISDIGPDQVFDELADLALPHHPAQALINGIVNGNRQFAAHVFLLKT